MNSTPDITLKYYLNFLLLFFFKPYFFIFVVSLFFISFNGFSQETISGTVKDAESGETIAYAYAYIKNNPTTGTTTNEYGYYSLTLPEGMHELVFESIGYLLLTQQVKVSNSSIKLNIELEPATKTLEGVIITGKKESSIVHDTRGSIATIQVEDIKELPAFAGEVDVIKVLQLSPGVTPSGEGSGGFHVRGGSIDQNLVLLDESPVYNPSHTLGIFSVFNADAIKGVTLYKGGIPAQYGGRTSSVVDIRMKDGNMRKRQVDLGVGILVSRATVQGPIKKDRGSVILSGRRTYGDLLLRLFSDQFSNSSLYFYDLNLKANYILGEKDRVYLSGYLGRDVIGLGSTFNINYGNTTGSLRWNHVFSDKLFSNTTFIVGQYQFQFGIGENETSIALQSIIADLALKQDYTYYLNNNNELKFGFESIYRRIQPGNLRAGATSGFVNRDAEEKKGLETSIYASNKQKVNDRLTINYGLRISLFKQLAPVTVYEFDELGNTTSNQRFTSSKNLVYYVGLEPRLAATYLLTKNSSVKIGFNRSFQYIHLLSNPSVSSPSDVWIMSSNNIKPQEAIQGSLGYFRTLSDSKYELSVEAYYKHLNGVIDYKNGADAFLNEEIENELLYGTGRAYGVELQFKKTLGKVTGWLSYTLSRTLKEIPGINNGNPFPARYDKINDISLVGIYKVSPKISLTANFIYTTGQAVTYPSGSYQLEGKSYPLYTERNGSRFPDYHRLDIGLTWYRKKTATFESSWSFSIYNVYNRLNAFLIEFRPTIANPNQTEAVQISLFGIIPAFSYQIRF